MENFQLQCLNWDAGKPISEGLKIFNDASQDEGLISNVFNEEFSR